jgi:hypothetical protein
MLQTGRFSFAIDPAHVIYIDGLKPNVKVATAFDMNGTRAFANISLLDEFREFCAKEDSLLGSAMP